ncbi:nucleotide sugar dehydrogenase [Candidatus Halobonum tyrrellensis]|uniref:UDP-N-acetyl-D-mannosamine dehydrogenase n=1 Tax=Candidatus Halobonum tyrrellensis G22 TaxID=1324957 RepID=V4HA37_9EURY|nr:nucleotide sugar dehydrogenase [Candidatus Halobonum tyrrellensis]ESP86913.1 UDP-N-acetyl-D-mannosaminuronic acid dehydrogenase [Candidatus Halobonum tyrrellensis G22]
MSRHPPKLHDPARSEAERGRLLREARVPIAVYGLGKIGLPLASVLADETGNVVGADIDEAVVETVNEGEVPDRVREPGLPELLSRTVGYGELRATTDLRTTAREAAVHVVVVPTRLSADGTADLDAVEAVVSEVASGLTPGDLVCIESTLPPGATEDAVLPTLVAESGLEPDEFGVAFCPERTSSGRAIEDIRGAYPKVVGGVDEESTRAATVLYEAINSAGVIPVSDATTAESVKLFEGVYRDVNIALANELARFTDALGADVLDAIEAANTQPYCDIHQPGAGVGGHCIPYYPRFLVNAIDASAPLIRTARRVNDSMPTFMVDQLEDRLRAADRPLATTTVLVCGVTYRPGVVETAETPAAPTIEELEARGADVLVVDPMLDDEATAQFGGTPVTLADLPDCEVDAAVVVTDHAEFEACDWDAVGGDDPMTVVDGRGVEALADSRHAVYRVGRGRTGRGSVAAPADDRRPADGSAAELTNEGDSR